jgi:hypothetical protein
MNRSVHALLCLDQFRPVARAVLHNLNPRNCYPEL